MPKHTAPIALVWQAIAFSVFCAGIGYFSVAPGYARLDLELALLRVSFSHAGARREPCRRFTAEEIAKTAPNMRQEMSCGRERVNLRIQIEVDEKIVLDTELAPAGLHADGAADVYARVPLRAGAHRLVARLRNSRRETGFDYSETFDLVLEPGDNRVLDFRSDTGGFRIL